MALSGNLRDFDLTYIFQIVAQEGKTGKLVLTAPRRKGTVIFRQGQIISVAEESRDIATFLAGYLVGIKGLRSGVIEAMRSSAGTNYNAFADQLVTNGYLQREELTSLASWFIEDFSCSFFLWEEGDYRFDTLANVDGYQIDNVAVQYETITMEAAYRIDEFQRMKKVISETTVFLRTDNMPLQGRVSPLEDLQTYMLSMIDGTSPVELLCKNALCSEYNIYEALLQLLEGNRITPLSDRLSRSIHMALRRKAGRGHEGTAADALVSSIVTGVAVAGIFFLSLVLMRGYFFADGIQQAREAAEAVHRSRREQKAAVAELWYHGRYGVVPASARSMVSARLLSTADAKNSRIQFRDSRQGAEELINHGPGVEKKE
jgi:hypothetical protein